MVIEIVKINSKDACPTCGEDNMDQLVWVDDLTVQCNTCGERYNPLYIGKAA